MTNGSILNNFIRYVSFNILGQMAYSCYTLADTFFVAASLGANGLTALNLAFPVFCIISGTGLMIGMGGGTRYSIVKSRGEDGAANQVFTHAVYMVVCFAALFVLSGIFFSGVFAKALGADHTVFAMIDTYLRILLLFSPAFLTNHLLQCFVRNDERPSLSMAAMISGSVSNVVLDYIFIFPLGLGIFGAAFATGLAPVISIAVISPYLLRKKNQFHFVKSIPAASRLAEIVSSGIPPFVTEITSGVVMFLFNFIILRLAGNIGVAAFSIITVISLVVIAMYTGLSQGIQPIISANHGAGYAAGVKSLWKYAMVTAVLLSGIIYAVIFFGASQIAFVFNSEHDAVLQTFAVAGMRLYFLACPFIGFNIVTATYFTSTERPRLAQAISLLRGFFVLVPVAFLLSSVFGMTGVWCAYPLAECVVALIAIVFYRWAGARGRDGFSRGGKSAA